MRLRVQVTATNGQGSAAQNSESSAPVIALPVKLRVTPQILGGNVVDTPLSLTAGTWDGSTPIAFTYSWRRCNPVGDLATCVQIPGATTTTYTPTVQDIGFSIRVWITGTNVAGSDVAITNHTFPIVDKQHFSPSVVTAPSVAGTMTTGRQLTADVGTYSGDLPITKTFVWQRCDATGANCHVIANAKKVVYFPTVADVGYTMRLAVTVTNAYGKSVVLSASSDAVSAAPPHVRGRRIVGNEQGRVPRRGRSRRRDLRARRQRHAARRRRRRPDLRRTRQRRDHRRLRSRPSVRRRAAPTRSSPSTASGTSSTAGPATIARSSTRSTRRSTARSS